MTKNKEQKAGQQEITGDEDLTVSQGFNQEALLSELKTALKAELKEEMSREQNAKKNGRRRIEETKVQQERSNTLVPYMVPIIEGEPEEVNVTINGKTWQILRGKQVRIPKMVAEVLDNQFEQAALFRKFKEEHREQVTVVNTAG